MMIFGQYLIFLVTGVYISEFDCGCNCLVASHMTLAGSLLLTRVLLLSSVISASAQEQYAIKHGPVLQTTACMQYESENCTIYQTDTPNVPPNLASWASSGCVLHMKDSVCASNYACSLRFVFPCCSLVPVDSIYIPQRDFTATWDILQWMQC